MEKPVSFLKKNPPLPTPALQALRPDLNRAVQATPPKVLRSLLSNVEVLNYLNERIPTAEMVENIAKCSCSIDEYQAGVSWRGCLVLTDKRLIVAYTQAGRSGITVLAWPFSEIASFSFEPFNVRGVPGCDASIGYGPGKQLRVSVDDDTNHSVAFLQAVQAHLNSSGRYSL
jgi:hypothetical protein